MTEKEYNTCIMIIEILMDCDFEKDSFLDKFFDKLVELIEEYEEEHFSFE